MGRSWQNYGQCFSLRLRKAVAAACETTSMSLLPGWRFGGAAGAMAVARTSGRKWGNAMHICQKEERPERAVQFMGFREGETQSSMHPGGGNCAKNGRLVTPGSEWPASRHRIASVFASWGRIAEDFRSENAHRQNFASHRIAFLCLAHVATHIASLPASRDMGHSARGGPNKLSHCWPALLLCFTQNVLQ